MSSEPKFDASAVTLGIWLVRSEGEALARRVHARLGGTVYRPWRQTSVGAEPPLPAQSTQFAAHYRQHRQWLLIGAAGIAVRFLDGLTRDKHSDPALVALDEGGRYAIALLAGHEGGANRLAYDVANIIGAVPVVTTATEALKALVVGIGCRKDATAEQIEAAVAKALATAGQRGLHEVREVATIDLKADEPGLLAFCARHDLPLRVFARSSVAARAWVTQPSVWVQKHVGLDGVCEPCALLAFPRGHLLVPKTTCDGVAIAIAEDKAIEDRTEENQ